MLDVLSRYARWLHLQWPAGTVEKLPEVGEDFSTNVPGLFVVGDLTGVPLLKLAADGGARVVARIAADLDAERRARDGDAVDVAIVGAGVSGMAAALEARRRGLTFEVFEATEPFSTIVNFPRRKPIYTYPTDLEPAGELRFGPRSDVKEGLVEELRAQTIGRGIRPRPVRVERVLRRGGAFDVVLAGGETVRARRVVVGIGRSGNFRKLGVPGEELDKVSNRLHDPQDFRGQDVLVVGGGDSALEAAIALARCGARVTVSYRGQEFSRPKPENVAGLAALVADPTADVAVEEPSSERVTTAAGGFLGARGAPGRVDLALGTEVRAIRDGAVVLAGADGEREVANDAVFAMIGREPPLDFFRRSGVHVRGEWRAPSVLALAAILLACVFVFQWKAGGALNAWFKENGLFPFNLEASFAAWPTLRQALTQPGFYYSLAYCLAVVVFGVRRIRRRKTPYVTVQTLTLAAIQVVPLFLLPYFVLPWLGDRGAFDAGLGRSFADAFFPLAGAEREYWRAFGFVLAWPLFIWNVFTSQPLTAWLVVSLVQTFVLIPLIIWRWGKGAYCGWICSCGALAETLGDAQRHKMPHGPRWNRLNLLGQGVLAAAFALLLLRITGWIWPDGAAARWFAAGLHGFRPFGVPFNYYWIVDVTLAGILGVGLYFHFSGRTWCRFACPLAALMHVYARFSRFRILAEKQKCISCNVCTSVCHQGIDVMNFANKGLPMDDPQCVRCSACVRGCPTGVLSFGEVDRRSGAVLRTERLAASPVRMAQAQAARRKGG